MTQSKYSTLLAPVLAWIDSHRGEALADLQNFCRQPSIAAQGIGMEEMVTLVFLGIKHIAALLAELSDENSL